MSTPIVQYENIYKSFGTNKVLRGIDLKIKPEEKVAIIGPSGSGKTTLIRLLMTLEQPTSGKIFVNGENLWEMEQNGEMVPANEQHLKKMRGQIGMVFQHFNLFPQMTILENCMISPVHVQKVKKEIAQEQAIDLLNRVGLGNKLTAYPNQLSGGQQQRVAMARALAMKPKIMLFDEVTSALDPEMVDEVLEVMRSLAVEDDMTMILVTHEIEFARDIADRIVFLDEGVIVDSGEPTQVLEHSQSRRLQDFLSHFRK